MKVALCEVARRNSCKNGWKIRNQGVDFRLAECVSDLDVDCVL